MALVTVLLAFEITVLLTSRTMTAALDRLQHLAAMQAAGDFSKRVSVTARSAIDRLAAGLVERADHLRMLYERALLAAGPGPQARKDIEALGDRHGLTPAKTATLRLSYFTDIRLPLFLFAAADRLPLSFLPIYTRAAGNPLSWLDENIVISLPLAGYLIAILIASPYSRRLGDRDGRRRLLLFAAAPTVIAQIGLYLASTVAEIVLWRTVTGFGYALMTLACQDYVIDTASAGERVRSLGMFSAVLFAGIFCGTALGGVMADRFGQANVFLFSAVLIAFSAMLVFRFVAPQELSKPSVPAAPLRIMATLRNRTFAALVFGIAIPINVVLAAFVSYLVALTLDSLGASVADIGRTLMLYFLVVAAIGSFSGRLGIDRIPAPIAAVTGQFVTGVSLLPATLWPGQLSMIVAMLGAGIGLGLVRSAEISVAMDLAGTDEAGLGQSSVLAALRTFERGGSIVGLLVIAALAGVLGYAGAIAAAAVWSLLGALVFVPFVDWTARSRNSGASE